MPNPEQLPLFKELLTEHREEHTNDQRRADEVGTFKDNLRAPVHSWFRYPAGYSYKFVEATFERLGVQRSDWVYDPFSGSGTTLITAKQHGINAYGVEAHSFVHWVAEVKLYWEYDLDELNKELEKLLRQSRAFVFKRLEAIDLDGVFPALVYKCYHPNDLKILYLLREFITHEVLDCHVHNLLKLALTDTLRGGGGNWMAVYRSAQEHRRQACKGCAIGLPENRREDGSGFTGC